MPRSYPYGKVPSSVATVISERFERPMVDCGYCSGQMLARTARAGVGSEGKVEAHLIRAKGGRPHWKGNTATELRKGLLEALDVETLGIAKSAVLARVKAGFAVAVSLTYAKLPDYLRVQVNDFGHCILLKGYRMTEGNVTLVGVFDPLWEQGAQGTWARWYDVEQALWDTGHTTSKVIWVPPTARYTMHISPGAEVRTYDLRKPASGGGAWCIQRGADGSYGDDTTWGGKASQAPCSAPVSRRTCDGKSSATTTLVTSGAFKDKHVRVGSVYGVTVSSKEA